MSQAGAGPSRRRGKYAPRACNVCRRRKCKCDGAHPVCKPCAVSGYECSWVPEGDEDRPATKQLVEGLRAKIQHLETKITQVKQGAPTSSGPRPDAGFSPTVSQSTVPSESLSDGGNLPSASAVRVEHVPSQASHQAQPDLALSLAHSYIQPTTDEQSTTSTSPEPMATLIDTQSALIYRYIFDIDTSLPLHEQPPDHRASLQCHWNRYLPDLSPVQLSRHEHDALLASCFSYGASWLFGLLPDLFLRDMLEYLSPDPTIAPRELHHYSPLLHCALLAFACSLSDDIFIREPSTRERFTAHAKQWLDQEFNYGNPSLTLSLILLSEYHMGIGERNTGYMYTGARSPIFDWYRWSVFIQEKSLAQEMGRPSEMPLPTAAITVPVALEITGQPLLAVSVPSLFANGDYTRVSLECFMQYTKLLSISPSIPPSSDSLINDIHQQLDSWFDALPESLVIRQFEMLIPPPVLALHIRYWWSILQLHPPNSAAGPTGSPTPATQKLVELFEAFDTQFELRYFPRNLLKAMHMCGRALILERSQGDGIDICMRGLGTWPCAERMLSDLEQLRSSMETVNGV